MRRMILSLVVVATTFIAGVYTGVYNCADPVYDALKGTGLTVLEIGATGTQTSVRLADNTITNVDQVNGNELKRVLNGLNFLKSVTLTTPDVDDDDLEAFSFDLDAAKGPLLEGGIELRSSSVTDKGMTHLANQIALQELSVADTQVTDVGIAKLHRLGHLRVLNVSGCALTDSGFSAIVKQHPKLSRLYVRGIDITPAVIDVLKTAEQLEWLDISSPITPIDQTVISSLRKSLPGCHIVCDEEK